LYHGTRVRSANSKGSAAIPTTAAAQSSHTLASSVHDLPSRPADLRLVHRRNQRRAYESVPEQERYVFVDDLRVTTFHTLS
jgi:hypothetical protein